MKSRASRVFTFTPLQRKAIRSRQKFNSKSWRDLDDVLELSQDPKYRDWRNIWDRDVRRQLQLLSRVGPGRLSSQGRKDVSRN